MSAFDFISPADWPKAVSAFGQYRVSRFLLNPMQWKSYVPVVTNLKWKRVKFDPKGLNRIPSDKKGLYSFVAEPTIAKHNSVKYLLYVGETHKQDLQARCRNYLAELTKKKPRVHIFEMLRNWPDHLWIHYAVVADVSKIAQAEKDLIAAFLPPFNRKFPATVRARIAAEFSR